MQLGFTYVRDAYVWLYDPARSVFQVANDLSLCLDVFGPSSGGTEGLGAYACHAEYNQRFVARPERGSHAYCSGPVCVTVRKPSRGECADDGSSGPRCESLVV